MSSKVWAFWGQPTMSYLRFCTLKTLSCLGESIGLVLREFPVTPQVQWRERQDFMYEPPPIDYMGEALKLPGVETFMLEDIAPHIAELKASDVHTSDLLAYWLLATRGGTVTDMDVVYAKPVPKVDACVKLVRFKGHPKAGYIPVTFMQGRPCKVWHSVYEGALERYDPAIYESCGTDAVIANVHPFDVTLLPEHIVFPFAGTHPWSSWHRAFWGHVEGMTDLPEDCIGIHWYAGHNWEQNRRISSLADLSVGGLIYENLKAVFNGK